MSKTTITTTKTNTQKDEVDKMQQSEQSTHQLQKLDETSQSSISFEKSTIELSTNKAITNGISSSSTPIKTNHPITVFLPPTPSSVQIQLRRNLASIKSLHPQIDLQLNNRFIVLNCNDQVRELQTVIRDKNTPRGDFKFYADRLIRLVVEEGLNLLPIQPIDVETPTKQIFHGLRYLKGNCGVSIVRSGESMEQGLRDCCRSIRIGKILIERNESDEARVLYTKFPKDVAFRKVLLLYPIMSTGRAVIESVKVLLNQGVKEENMILLNLFCSPKAAKLLNSTYPKVYVLTSDIHKVCPNHFVHRYFGTN